MISTTSSGTGLQVDSGGTQNVRGLAVSHDEIAIVAEQAPHLSGVVVVVDAQLPVPVGASVFRSGGFAADGAEAALLGDEGCEPVCVKAVPVLEMRQSAIGSID
jgi:hypothetical protein